MNRGPFVKILGADPDEWTEIHSFERSPNQEPEWYRSQGLLQIRRLFLF